MDTVRVAFVVLYRPHIRLFVPSKCLSIKANFVQLEWVV
jgi:hypothetical protein